MGGARERGGGRCGIADLGVDADVGARPFVHARRVLLRRRRRFGHCRQELVVDLDPLGAVLGGQQRFGDDHRHRLADKTRLVGRQRDNAAG